MPTTADLVTQLNSLLRLTETEIVIVETRRAQATTDDIERELAAMADRARERVRLLTDAIRGLGAAPDAIGVVAGRVAATTKIAIEQGQDLVDALLGDLALEHELLNRARYARMVADELGETRARRVLERLELAHGTTIEWLTTRLAEVAVGGPAALRPSPVQTAVGVGRRVATLPMCQSAQVVNRSLEAASQLRARASDAVSVNFARSRQLLDAAAEIWTAGRDASLKRSEELAERRGDRRTARRVHEAREELGALDGRELPIRGYDRLTAPDAVSRIQRLREPADARTVLAYESANKHRKSVMDAARERVEQLAADLAAVS